MNPKNKRTLFLTSTICIILSIVAFALSHMGGASNENYILLYVIAVLLNIVLNLALSIKIASTNGAKALVSLGKWIMPIAGVVYLIPQVYSVLFPAKTMQDTYWYVFIGILFIVSGNYFPKNHINPYIGLKFPWLFNDEEGWYKTHRLGSYTWILAGIVSILHPLHNLVFVTVPLIIFWLALSHWSIRLSSILRGNEAIKGGNTYEVRNKAYCYQHHFVCIDAGSLSRFL